MEHIANRIAACAVAGILSIGLSQNAVAQAPDAADPVSIETVHPTAYRAKEPIKAPAARKETKTSAPAAGAVWIPGYWDLRANRATAPRAGWVWEPGRWVQPPVAGARWDPAHWGWSNEWWSWTPGHWDQRERHGYPPSLESDQESQLEMSAPPPS